MLPKKIMKYLHSNFHLYYVYIYYSTCNPGMNFLQIALQNFGDGNHQGAAASLEIRRKATND